MIYLRAGITILFGVCGLVAGRNLRHHNAEHTSETKNLISSNFIGEATNELATAMLQESLEEEGNYVFSPIGYSTILAILAEGARGETRSQLATSLHFPEDLSAVRQSYKALLHRMKDKGDNKPEFKNWFYAYRNYSIQTQYKEVLLENYLTEVKAVEFEYYDNSADDDLLSMDKKKNGIKEIIEESNTEHKEKDDDKINKIVVDDKVVKKDEEKSGENKEVVGQTVEDHVQPEKEESNQSKVESKPVTHVVPDNKEKEEKQKLDNSEKIVSQSNKIVLDVSESDKEKEPKEKPDKITTEEMSTIAEVGGQIAKEQETEKKKDSETEKDNKVDSKQRKLGMTRKIKGRRYFLNKDTVTALTANRLSSSKKSEDKEENSNKKIIIFNGFYYKGNWTMKFHTKNDDSPEGKTFFYTSESEKKPAKMMTTVGEFEIGQIPELESTALEVPYEEQKYSLLVLLPNKRNGLKKLAADLEGFPLPKIDQYLTKKEVQVCLPKVNFYTISKPKPALLKGGVKNLFTKEADLSGINSEGGLFLDELVQLVTMNFEETSTATNFLTSSLAVTRSNSGPELFNANHPFFFFLRERQDGIILAAGKLQDPTKTSHDS